MWWNLSSQAKIARHIRITYPIIVPIESKLKQEENKRKGSLPMIQVVSFSFAMERTTDEFDRLPYVIHHEIFHITDTEPHEASHIGLIMTWRLSRWGNNVIMQGPGTHSVCFCHRCSCPWRNKVRDALVAFSRCIFQCLPESMNAASVWAIKNKDNLNVM